MIAQELEVILHRAFVEARGAGHEFITVEHLLLAVLRSPAVSELVNGCGANVRELSSSLSRQINSMDRPIVDGVDIDTQPNLAFQRVMQRAILQVQTDRKKGVDAADVLLAIFSEPKSYAVQLLNRYGVTRQRVIDDMNPAEAPVAAPPVTASPPAASPRADLADATEVQVVIYNDDFTPMAFVMRLLRELFGMGEEDAKETMLEVHRKGAAVCGLYAREDGVSLVEQVLALAEKHGHPLMCEAVVPKQPS